MLLSKQIRILSNKKNNNRTKIMFQIQCTKCNSLFELPPEYRGQIAVCGGCNEKILIPSPNPIDESIVYPAQIAEDEKAQMLQCNCPKCSAAYELSNDFLHLQVECGECGTLFIVGEDPPPPPPEETAASDEALSPSETPATMQRQLVPDDRTVKIKRPGRKTKGMIPVYDAPKPNEHMFDQSQAQAEPEEEPSAPIPQRPTFDLEARTPEPPQPQQATEAESMPTPEKKLPWYLFWKKFLRK